ncbi:tRNA-dihydrouridine(47) synthase [NAD(P)(+)] [Abortiporus biennis]
MPLFRLPKPPQSLKNLLDTFLQMSRRSRSPSPHPSKRQKLDHEQASSSALLPPLTPDDYKNGVMLAPMVRSGALPTRLFALKHGAKLVWGPEVVDKAILHAERVVDPITGVISYNGKSKAIFTTHPLEKPFLIYQIGSSDPATAVEAAKAVQQDIAGIDLNCGCPKPFSTHAGMGAALLSTPDLLCSILTALREALPSEISVSCKIRLLPTQEDTLKLVERIVGTGINCLTVHCRTRNMRPGEPALIDRLSEIVEFVEGLGKGIAVIENGDCESYDDAKRIRALTGAHSAMIARAAEANPTVFAQTPYMNLEKTFIPSYLRITKYLDNHWASTKFCSSQFYGTHDKGKQPDLKAYKHLLNKARSYEDVGNFLEGGFNVEETQREWKEIVDSLEQGVTTKLKSQAQLEIKPTTTDSPRKTSTPETAISSTLASSCSSSASSPEIESNAHTPPQTEETNTPTTTTPLLLVNPNPIFKTPPVYSGPPDDSLLRAPLLGNCVTGKGKFPVPAFVDRLSSVHILRFEHHKS